MYKDQKNQGNRQDDQRTGQNENGHSRQQSQPHAPIPGQDQQKQLDQDKTARSKVGHLIPTSDRTREFRSE